MQQKDHTVGAELGIALEHPVAVAGTQPIRVSWDGQDWFEVGAMPIVPDAAWPAPK